MPTKPPVEIAVELLKKDPKLLFEVKEQLARITVFGPWKDRCDGFGGQERPEPAKRETRVTVWYCDGASDLAEGWYYRVGFGVIGIPGFENRKSFKTADECKAAVDAELATQDDIFLVNE